MTTLEARLGTFNSFRRAMFEAVRNVELAHLNEEAAGFTNPFAHWQAGAPGDYHTTLLELWAYLADILTFYQERIANEAYLPTATQRDSLRRLAALLNYRPGPGAAASALAVFNVEQNKAVNIPAGLRLGSRAAQGKAAAVFETSTAFKALAEHNAIPVSATAPSNQFAALGNQNPMYWFQQTPAELWESVTNVYPLGGASYYNTLVAALVAKQARLPVPPVVLPSAPKLAVNKAIWWPDVHMIYPDMRTVVLQGINNRLSVGDYVLLVEEIKEKEKATTVCTLQQISTVKTDKAANTTTITWKEKDRTRSYQNVTLFAFRVKAALFGSIAPFYYSLPAALTNSDGKHPHAPFQTNWDKPPASVANVDVLYLDSVYDEIKAAPDNYSWAALVNDAGNPLILQVEKAHPVTYANYAITARVTQIKLVDPIGSEAFELRKTLVLAASEPLRLQERLPLADPLADKELILDGLYPALKAGMIVIVQGEVYQTAAAAAPRQHAETAVVAQAPSYNKEANLTTVKLKESLKENYVRAKTVLLANVAEVTHGETVRDEILGSGNGGALQSFRLKKNPLTYLPAPETGVASALRVTVNGVQWQEQATLAEAAPDAQVFTTAQDDAGHTIVCFGDGTLGARPASGKDNVRARYRKGLGEIGNVEAEKISQLLDNLPSLQSVSNPLPSFGGEEPESANQIRINAPGSLRTFGRAVSADDYAALALTYPGVAQARATWVLRDAATGKPLAQPHIQLVVATLRFRPLSEQGSFGRKLRGYLDQHRDPNVPLRIVDFTPVYVECVAVIDVMDGYPQQATLARALAALNPGRNPDGTLGFFASERLGFGQSIYLSDVYAALQAVPGVRNARVTTLRKLKPGEVSLLVNSISNEITLSPNEIVVMRNDPTLPDRDRLTIALDEGGYDDV